MFRTTIGLSFILVLGGMAACSSKPTGSSGTAGSNGAVLSGGTTGTATGGSTSTATGGTTSTATGGTTTATGGTSSSAAGACADTTVTCVDTTNAKSCNPATGVVDTFSCIDDSAAIGIVSKGCTSSALDGDSCSIDGFSDADCQAGTAAFAYCYNKTDDTSLFNIYVNCFLNFMDGHTVIPCYAKYVTSSMKTAGDCANAESLCFSGGEGGAGGAGP